MAKDKKSFLMYADWIFSIKHLTDEQAGKLLKHLLSYVNDEEPETDDPIINITFEPIKQQLKRDLEKWDVIRGKRSDAGKKSAQKRAQQKLTSVKSVQQDSTNPTVNDNVNVTVNVNDIKQKAFISFWTKYPKKVAKDKCKDKFLKLKQTEIDIILNTLDNFLLYKPFKDYTHPNPMTYLNQKRWNDEIETVNKANVVKSLKYGTYTK